MTQFLSIIMSTLFVLLQHQSMQNVNKNIWYYLVYIISILIVLIVLGMTIKYLIKPNEKSEDHIKRIILRDEGEEK